MKREIRYSPSLELRTEEDGKVKIRGYAAVFNQLSNDLGGFREKIAKGAFARSLGNDVRALVDHDPARIIGRSKNGSGTLVMREDDHGLHVEITPPDTTAGRDVVESIRRGDLDQMSFGFRTIADSWSKESGTQIRELREADLVDVSVVAFPAYPQTSVAMRSLFPEGLPEVIEEHTTRQMPDMEAKMQEMQQKMAEMQTSLDAMKAQCDQMKEQMDMANSKADQSEMKASAAVKDADKAKTELAEERTAFAAEKNTHAAALKRALGEIEQATTLCRTVGEELSRRSRLSNRRLLDMESQLAVLQELAKKVETELADERKASEDGEAAWMKRSRTEIEQASKLCGSVKDELGRRERLWSMNA